LRTKLEKHRENTDKKMDEIREMFEQLVLNQNRGKWCEEERHRRRRNPDFDEQSKRAFLYQLHKLQQRDRTVEVYRQKIELLMLKGGIREEPRKTIDRFKSGLNLEIWDRVELFPFNYFKDSNEIVQQCVRIEQGIIRMTTTREDYFNTSYSRREFKREDHPSKSRYEGSPKDERERKIEKSFSGVEPDIDKIFPSITKPCEDVLEEKFVFGAEPDIYINVFSTKKTNDGLIEKEVEETKKEECSLMTPLQT